MRSVPHSRLTTGFVTRVPWRVSNVKQELLILQEVNDRQDILREYMWICLAYCQRVEILINWYLYCYLWWLHVLRDWTFRWIIKKTCAYHRLHKVECHKFIIFRNYHKIRDGNNDFILWSSGRTQVKRTCPQYTFLYNACSMSRHICRIFRPMSV